jgi:adenine-specific DNA-methyltransferase
MLNYYRSQKKKKSKLKKEQEKLDLEHGIAESVLTIEEKNKILQEHIFGVDIDEQAVEVTKLSLMLKMLEGEFGIIPGRSILPMLDKNIRCGNSLISGNTLELKKYFGDDWYKVKAFNWKDAFRKIMVDEGGFDVVIGNPPYRKERDSKDLIKEVKEAILGQLYHEGKMDFWYFFLHRGLEVTKVNGLISFIVPSYWLMGAGAKKLISHIKRAGKINFIVNFHRNKIFHDVSGRHMIFNISRSSAINDYQFTVFQYIKSGLTDTEIEAGLENEKYVKKSMVKFNTVFCDGKIMLSRTGFFDKLKVPKIDLSYICEVSQGIVEATDRIGSKMLAKTQSKVSYRVGQGVFVLSNIELRRISPNQKERLFLKRYLDAKDVMRYYYTWRSNYVWYVGSKENKHICKNKNDYKNMVTYLDSVRQFITSSNKPYGIHRIRKKYFFENPKLLCKNMIDKPCFTYCDEELYVNLSFNVVILTDKSYSLKYILGTINSKFGEHWFNTNAKKRGANIDIGVSVMRKFPIRKIDFSNSDEKKIHDNLVALVEVMLDLNKKAQIARGSRKDQIQRQIERTDREIDDLVYRLYGITDEERKIIEGG